jgi:chromosome segregation ATPase
MALSPEIKDAINNIESHAAQLQAVLTLADYVKDIGSLEQAASEAENRKTAAQKELDAAKAETEKAKAATLKQVERLQQQEAEAEAVVAKAKEDAEAIAAQANRDAKGITDKARTDADRIKADADAEVQQAKAALSLVKADVAAEQERLADLTAQCEAVIKKADEARAYLANLAGK